MRLMLLAVDLAAYFAACSGSAVLPDTLPARPSSWSEAHSLGRLQQRRVGGRGSVQRQLQRVQVGQVVEVVGRDRAFGQPVNLQEHFAAARQLRAVDFMGAFQVADERLAAAELVGQCSLSQRFFLAPLRKSHDDEPPTGPELGRLYCADLYSVAIYKHMQAVDYYAALSNVVVMKPDNRLRALRKAAGMTQAELADKTGVSQPAISQLENGLLSMDMRWMRAFARALGCAPVDLLPDEDNPDRLVTADERDLVQRYRRADPAAKRIVDRMVSAAVDDAGDEGEKAA